MKKNKKGFTLIELLVVIAIIGLLATLSVIALNTARVKARDARRVSDIKQIQTALEMYFDTNDGYPNSTSTLQGSGFMSSVPVNPQPIGSCATSHKDYVYKSTASSTYTLAYCLENSGGSVVYATATPAGIK
ncbi:MAG: type II secretion system protein [Lactococcus chungangensis]|nr:type II secretion system protein [Lactococcus chungangensis]